jgi:iron-sulfur cluster insertion protein
METLLTIPDYRSSGEPLLFTAAAAHKVHELIAEEGNPALKLRVYITGGGCSGWNAKASRCCVIRCRCNT